MYFQHLLGCIWWFTLLIRVVLEYSLKVWCACKQPNHCPQALWAVHLKGRLPPAALWQEPLPVQAGLCSSSFQARPPSLRCPQARRLLGEQEGRAVPVAAGGPDAQGSLHWILSALVLCCPCFPATTAPSKWYSYSAFPLVQGLSSQLTSFVKER